MCACVKEDGFLVSKETVVLRQWKRSKQKFGSSNELINQIFVKEDVAMEITIEL